MKNKNVHPVFKEILQSIDTPTENWEEKFDRNIGCIRIEQNGIRNELKALPIGREIKEFIYKLIKCPKKKIYKENSKNFNGKQIVKSFSNTFLNRV